VDEEEEEEKEEEEDGNDDVCNVESLVCVVVELEELLMVVLWL
jgi:hypothetical protein